MIPVLHSYSLRNRFREDPGFTIEDGIELAARWGFAGIEIMAGKAQSGAGDFASDDPAYLRSVMRRAAQAGLTVTCLATYNDFAYVKDEAWRLANIAYIQKWLRLAGDLGVPNIRMLTGYAVEGEDRTRLETLTRDGIALCLPVAEEAGVNMAVENHNSLFFQAEEIVSLIREFGSPRLTACPDPSNGVPGFLEGKASPEAREAVFSTARVLAPFATNSHLKVRGIDEDGHLSGFGRELARLFRLYRDGGFSGPAAVESVQEGDLLHGLDRVATIIRETANQI